MSYLSLWQRKGTPIQRMLFDMLTGDAGETLYERTIINNPASFTTEVAKPLKGLSIPFLPVQSGFGDPSTSNVRPITGWTGLNINRTGINLCGCEWEEGQIVYDGTDGKATDRKRTIGYFPVIGGQSYRIVSDDEFKRVYWYDKEKTFISSNTASAAVKTAPSNAFYARAVVIDATTPHPEETFSFNFPSTETEYFPYSGTTIPVSWQTEAGTVYGGALDALTGVLTVGWKTVDMGSLTFYKSSATSSVGGSVFAVAIGSVGDGLFARERNEQNPVMSDVFKTATDSTWYVNNLNNNEMFSDKTSLFIAASEYDTKEEFTEAVSGHVLAYKLATPQTVQLDPVTLATLIGENVIWTDTNSDNTIVYLSKTEGAGLGGGFGGGLGGGFGGGFGGGPDEPGDPENPDEPDEPTEPEEPVTDE